MKTEIIETWQEVDALSREWNALLNESKANSVFLTWEWICAWRRAVNDKVSPFLIVVRTEDGRLVGLGAFYNCTLVLGETIPYRCLRTLGDYPTGAEYPDWIVHQSCEREAAETIACALRARRADWDVAWFPFLSGWTGAYERLKASCDYAGLRWLARPTDFSAIRLPGTYAEYERMLSKGMREQQLRQAQRSVFERSGAQFELCEKSECLAESLEALFTLNTKRWAATGLSGTFVRKPLEARFYREFCPVALERDWLRLGVLKVQGEIKAVSVGYVYKGRYYSLQAGFDPDGPRGLGHALTTKVLERLIGEGVAEYDFLGTFVEHKSRYGAKLRYGYQVLIGRPGIRTAPLFLAKVSPTGRYLKFRDLPS